MNPLSRFKKRRQPDPADGSKDKIEPGDIITLFASFGPVREASVYVIERSGQPQGDVYAALMQSFRCAVEVCRPGMTVARVLSAAYEPLRQSRFVKGLSSRLAYALVHTGKQYDFYPLAGDNVLVEGMELSIEPTIQVAGLRAFLLSPYCKCTRDVIKVGRIVQVKQEGCEFHPLGHGRPPESLEVLGRPPDAMR